MLQEKRKELILQEEIIEALQKDFEPFKQLMANYRCAMMEVETKFKVLNEEYSLAYDRNPIESIKTRLKTMEGIAKKLKSKQLPLSIQAIEDSLYDVAGIRVICSFPEDIYSLAECLLKQDDIVLISRKDYISTPKENGYRSLHLIIEIPIFLANEKKLMKVEVQLRTIAMDFWASLEHKVRYKKDISDEIEQEIMKELKACADISANLDLRMEAVKNKIVASK